MAKQVINFGTTINDGTGDSLRAGAQKINSNFTELYNLLGGSESISIVTKITADDGLVASSSSGDITIRSLPATQLNIGAVKIGDGISVDEEGTISVSTYSLPKAATNILGGIKVGNNLEINNDGVLSAIASPYVLPTASPSVKGGVKIGTGLEIIDGVLNVTTSEIAAALQSGAVTVQLVDDGEVTGRLKASGPLIVLAGGQDSNDNYVQLQWSRDRDNPDTVKSNYLWLDTNGINFSTTDPVGTEEVPAYSNVLTYDHTGTLTFNSQGKVGPVQHPSGIDLFANSNMSWSQLNYDNTNFVWVTADGAFIDTSTLPAPAPASRWEFNTDATTVIPGSITIKGDTTVQQATVDQLTIDANIKSNEINDIQQQIGTKQSEMAYWQGVASQGPENPQYGQALTSINALSQQIGMLQGSLNIAQGELNLIIANLNAASELLSNASATLTYVVEDGVLNINNGGIRFPDGSVQTTAFNSESAAAIDTLEIGTEIIFNDLTVQKTAYNAVTPNPNSFEPFAPLTFFGISPSKFTWITDDGYSYRVSGSLVVSGSPNTNIAWFAFDPTKFNSGVLNVEVSFGRDLNGTTENRYVGTVNFGKVDVGESTIINASAQMLGLRETSLVTFNHIIFGDSPDITATIEQGSQNFPSMPVVAIAYNVPLGAVEANNIAYIKFSGTLFSVEDLGIESYTAGIII